LLEYEREGERERGREGLPDGANEVADDDEVPAALKEEAHNVPVVPAFGLGREGGREGGMDVRRDIILR
jgi:hypothetical protein